MSLNPVYIVALDILSRFHRVYGVVSELHQASTRPPPAFFSKFINFFINHQKHTSHSNMESFQKINLFLMDDNKFTIVSA